MPVTKMSVDQGAVDIDVQTGGAGRRRKRIELISCAKSVPNAYAAGSAGPGSVAARHSARRGKGCDRGRRCNRRRHRRRECRPDRTSEAPNLARGAPDTGDAAITDAPELRREIVLTAHDRKNPHAVTLSR